jgi:dTDP-4-dehydrorhamnose 3,5-epimerase
MELKIEKTNIPGLLVVTLPLNGDERGWFKENWQREKMVALGLPDFKPVQNNISYNANKGVTRGIHAEPWDKFVSLAAGKIFGAWVDLRQGKSFGQVFTMEISPSQAVFVPRGVANSYQALEDGTAYTYLVNAHWSKDAKYAAVNLADKSLGIGWPIALEKAIVSEKDRLNPMLDEVKPFVQERKMVITGAHGQLGQALQAKYPEALPVDREELDITDYESVRSFDWTGVDVIVNAAAYTNVDGAETAEGRVAAWQVNAAGAANLARIATEKDICLVHVSSDYVFDGETKNHQEAEKFAPLSVYGAAKAAGDVAVATAPKHYICRTSWLIGEGKNFVRIMMELGDKGVSPKVVDDQFGRLTFTDELVRVIDFLLQNQAPFGVYNVSNSGVVKSWADIAGDIFGECGFSQDVVKITTSEYFEGKENVAVRPKNSDFCLDKIHALGFKSHDWEKELIKYIRKERKK